MKKIFLISILLLIVLLSGCASPDQEEDTEKYTFNSVLPYNSSSLTFTKTSRGDMLYSSGSPSTDYVIMLNEDNELSQTERDAYVSLFVIIEVIAEGQMNFSYISLLSYTSQEFSDLASNAGIELTVSDIIMFNTLKTSLEELMLSSHLTVITRQEYIEIRLDRDLTLDEISGLSLLQEKISEMQVYENEYFNFETETFETLLLQLENTITFVPTEVEETNLLLAFNIVKLLHGE